MIDKIAATITTWSGSICFHTRSKIVANIAWKIYSITSDFLHRHDNYDELYEDWAHEMEVDAMRDENGLVPGNPGYAHPKEQLSDQDLIEATVNVSHPINLTEDERLNRIDKAIMF